jgi:hypothetical protein
MTTGAGKPALFILGDLEYNFSWRHYQKIAIGIQGDSMRYLPALLIIVTLAACTSAPSESAIQTTIVQTQVATRPNTPLPQPTDTPVPSAIGHMQCNREKTWIATSQSVLDEYLRANLDQASQLTVQGKVFLVNCGTSVRVLDLIQNAVTVEFPKGHYETRDTAKVQILEGEYKDRIGWTTTNFVKVP